MGSTFYTGIDGGLVTPKSDPVDLPMTLEPGESRSLFVSIGIRVPSNVFEVLSGIDPGKRTTEQATIALGRKGLDLYGNQVDFKEIDGSYMLTIEPDKQKSPRFWFKATTGRGNAFAASSSTYDRPR